APVRSTNVRLSIITMSAALVALSTPLGAQRRGAWTVGFAGTLGGGWQVEAADVGYARAVRAGPMRVASLTARLGSFVDEGAILGGARGFVFGLTLGGHTGLLPLADLGTETSKSEVGVDLTVEGTAYLGARSPFPKARPCSRRVWRRAWRCGAWWEHCGGG